MGNKTTDITDEIPFEIPQGWIYTRLKYITNIFSGGTPLRSKKEYWDYGKIPWLKIQDLTSSKKYVRKSTEFITQKGLNSSSAKMMERGTLLYTIFATIGEVKILDFDACCNQAIAGLVPYYDDTRNYLYYYLVNLQTIIKSNSHGLAQQNINLTILSNAIVCLPPLAEQQLIVECLDKLEPLLDEYEKLVDENEKLDNEFPNKLKQSILQYAMEGKLVKQDPNDEPASVLLEKIKQEKEKLIKEGKAKRDKSDSTIYQGDDKKYYEKIGNKVSDITDEIPFEIPNPWEFIRFRDLVYFNLGATPERKNKEYWLNGTIPWVAISDLIENGHVNKTREFVTEYAIHNKFKNKMCSEGTLLMSFKLTIGKTSITEIECVHNEAIISIYPYYDFEHTIRDYLSKFLPLIAKYSKKTNAIKGETLNSKIIESLLVPIPPLAEQRRIAKRLEELKPFLEECEKLIIENKRLEYVNVPTQSINN